MSVWIKWFNEIGITDIPQVGGKNASLGEMVRNLSTAGVRVPDGFAVTSDAYWRFLSENGLEDQLEKLAQEAEKSPRKLRAVGIKTRGFLLKGSFPSELSQAIRTAYRGLAQKTGEKEPSVAVRSSATAEDLPDASFAGQQETFLNIRGEEPLLAACRKCYASLFTDRAISYRIEKGYSHKKVALSIGVQRMVRSDIGASGVMFSIDTDSGFPRVALLNAAFGLGETVVQGEVDPDEYMVFKPLLDQPGLTPILEKKKGSKRIKLIYGPQGGTRLVRTSKSEQARYVLSDPEIMELARWAALVEKHYGKPMDMEWAKDGRTGELFMVQARPETVQSRKALGILKSFRLLKTGTPILTGMAVGEGVAVGPVCRVKSAKDIGKFKEGSILAAEMTDPDWVPIMKKAKGIVTDHGGRTCHAAIVSRELGIPAVVGTGRATRLLKNGQMVTLSCAEGLQGSIYPGALPFEEKEIRLDQAPKTRTQILMNIASPDAAFQWWHLPVQGIGLARMEFLVSESIKVHPMALVNFRALKDKKAKALIARLTEGYADKKEYFVDKLSRGLAQIAATQYPKPVIVRLSDFKTNEYANLVGGAAFEPKEENPMIGWRGASRYYSPGYQPGFELECAALKRARETLGLDNIVVMVPFCRTLGEADKVLAVMATQGLKRGEKGLQVYMMCEIPANVILAEEFAERFDGFSIGSNDLTQLTLGVDRDSGILTKLFDERDEAVTRSIAEVIRRAKASGAKIGICGQAPSDHPEFAAFLVRCGIDSISLNPDSVLKGLETVAAQEAGTARAPVPQPQSQEA
ncbi:MAG TPA: phosphoenolpyruvate synthase [bacterium]|nr:phosphoenolpyruvate synthase [bacterium]